MSTVTIKATELECPALDWAVAQCEGVEIERDESGLCFNRYYPSYDWSLAGPIIDRENIGISPPTSRVHRNGGNSAGWGPSGYWSATTWHKGANGRRSIALHESSALIAAMRCYVESKLGETVEVPQELVPAAQQTQGGE
jgi:hypothetical protein